MPHPYSQDDDALINPLDDEWPAPTPEEEDEIAAQDERLSRADATPEDKP